ncbi:MAG: phospholipase D-like domain-containing protein [Gemmatimonadaceae bacterium]
MHWLGYVALAVAVLVVGALALVGFLYLTRGTPVHRVRAPGDAAGPPGVHDPLFCHTMELLTKTPLAPGHRVEVTTCGDETYPRLWEDLRSAQRSITLQMYYCQPGRMADELREILIERARAGVRVLFLRDAFGSGPLPEAYIDSLKAGGVQVAVFRPTRWYELHKVQHRSHIRVVVVDGVVGWTGGFGIDDKWYGDGRHADQWRDTNVRFEGPAVLQLQATLAAGWAEATGELLTGDHFFPAEEQGPAGGVLAGLLHAAPTIGSTSAERFLALSIASARERLYVTNSYFVPDDDFCDLLAQAAKRGADVRVLTCDRDGDVKATYYAGRTRYERLLRDGVRIFEYRPAMMHAKSIVVDGRWAAAGTMNFDNRSLAFNDESVLMALDDDLGARLEQIFLADLEYAAEIHLDQFRRRPLTDRVIERAAASVARVL